jgi:GAF domain-containing protein
LEVEKLEGGVAMDDREAWVTDTLVELADTLVSDFDLAELLSTLVTRCVQLLDAAEVGIVLVSPGGALQAMASSSERMRAIELLELQSDEGPCLDAIASGRALDATPLDDAARRRWPAFAAAATDAGYRRVLALPMRLRDEVIGAVNVFCDHDVAYQEADLRVAQALTDTATIAIFQDRAMSDSEQLVAQLQQALNTRVVIEQAKGMLAEAHGISVDTAFDVLRAFARNHNRRLSDIARALAARELGTELLRHRSG